MQMQKGKLSEPALKRSVLRQLNKDRNGGPEYGADGASVRQNGGTSVYSVVNTVPGFETDLMKYVLAAQNNLAVCEADPEAYLLSAVLPPDYEEAQLKQDMKRLADVKVIGGHTQISDRVTAPVYSVTGIGRRTVDRDPSDVQTLLKPGDDLVVTEAIALAGTAALAIQYEKELLEKYPFSIVDRAKSFEQLFASGETARAITHFGAAAMHDLSQGGIFNALWEMADRAGTGLEVDLKRIPVRQETIEICEYFDINPYYLYSAGSILAGTGHGEALVSYLEARGIRAAVIGRATDGKDRVIRNGEECRYLDRPKQDEWYRMPEKR